MKLLSGDHRMDDFFSSNLFATIVIGAVSMGLLKLLIAVNRRHWQKEDQEKLEIAMELFDGDEAAAKVWLSTPVKSLGQRRPSVLRLKRCVS